MGGSVGGSVGGAGWVGGRACLVGEVVEVSHEEAEGEEEEEEEEEEEAEKMHRGWSHRRKLRKGGRAGETVGGGGSVGGEGG